MMRWLVPIVMLGISLPAAPAKTFEFEGIAEGRDGQRLYREQHRVSGSCEAGHWRPADQRVDYLRPSESGPFASKRLKYPESLLRPEVNFEQPDFDERLEITRPDRDKLAIRWTFNDQEAGRWNLEPDPRLVIDAGFDHFIRKHWQALTEGEAVPFVVLAPTRGESFDFVAEPAPDPLEGADHSFRIRPRSMVMRLLVDPIRLGYRDDGFLTHYSGLGNIRRNEDENHVVSIRYRSNGMPSCSLLPGDGQN